MLEKILYRLNVTSFLKTHCDLKAHPMISQFRSTSYRICRCQRLEAKCMNDRMDELLHVAHYSLFITATSGDIGVVESGYAG